MRVLYWLAMEHNVPRFGYGQQAMANLYQENVMNKDQVKGHVEEAKGKVKEVAGRILDDAGMEVEGNVQKNAGKVQAAVGDVKEDVKKHS
jgi:uncharacterized protein YjbJ (UPF0337 family)